MKSVLFLSQRLSKLNIHNHCRFYNAFADPTYDVTFKMIFGNERNKHLLISLINSLLNFQGPEAVKDLEIITNEIPISYEGHIKTAIDVRCKIVDDREILVEVQRQYKEYFLSRTQYYMAKALNLQMQDKQSKLYNVKMLPIYLLTISRESLFRSSDHGAFENDTTFEKTVIPTILEHKHIEFPGNKMHWKFYELNKFKKACKEVTSQDPIKLQWLDFLSKCSEKLEIPEVNELVKKAYGIMERAKWNTRQIEAFELAVANEILEENHIDNLRRLSLEEGFEESKKQIALKMLAKQEPKTKIAEYTGLSIEQINSLKPENEATQATNIRDKFRPI